MSTKKSRRSLGGLTLLLSGLLAVASLFVASGVMPAMASTTTAPAFVRVCHCSPYVGTADVFVDGNAFLSDFAFATVSNYAAIPPGAHTVQIALVGKGIGGAALSQTLDVQPGSVYTVAAIGTSPTNLGLEVFKDNNAATPGSAKARVYNLAADGGLMSVSAGGNSLVSLQYQEASNYLSLPSGSTSFTMNSAQAGSSLSLSAALQANTVTSIFAVGLFTGAPQARLVSQQTNALPGLPQTGSDPHAFTAAPSQSGLAWLLATLALALAGGTFFTWRRFAAR